MAGGSFGLQIGGQDTDLVLVAVNDRGMQDLLKSQFKIGADAAAAAGPVGRNTQASTNLTLKSELLTYSRSPGLFAGIDLDGTVVSQNTDDTNTYYSAPHTFDQILKGNVLPPDSSKPFSAPSPCTSATRSSSAIFQTQAATKETARIARAVSFASVVGVRPRLPPAAGVSISFSDSSGPQLPGS